LKYIQGVEVEHEDVQIKLFIFSLSLRLQDQIKVCCKPKGISSFIDLVGKFLEHCIPPFQTYENILQELTTSLKREGFFPDLLVEDLREAHHAQEEDSIGSIHPHEDNTLEFAQPIEEERWDEFSQKLKENVKEDKKFCRQLVDRCRDVQPFD
jgi:hypothetical protein